VTIVDICSSKPFYLYDPCLDTDFCVCKTVLLFCDACFIDVPDQYVIDSLQVFLGCPSQSDRLSV